MQKHFEVRTGKNKGFYIVTHNDKNSQEYKILAEVWGILPYEYNSTLYKFHKVSPQDLLWTHSNFGGHEYSRRVYAKLLQQLGCNDWQAFAQPRTCADCGRRNTRLNKEMCRRCEFENWKAYNITP